jgi:hypothetical protein
MDFANADLLVDARAILLDWRRGFNRATNGCDLLCCCTKPFAPRFRPRRYLVPLELGQNVNKSTPMRLNAEALSAFPRRCDVFD